MKHILLLSLLGIASISALSIYAMKSEQSDFQEGESIFPNQLILAIEDNNSMTAPIVRQLLNLGADPLKIVGGKTALGVAMAKNKNVARIIIEHLLQKIKNS